MVAFGKMPLFNVNAVACHNLAERQSRLEETDAGQGADRPFLALVDCFWMVLGSRMFVLSADWSLEQSRRTLPFATLPIEISAGRCSQLKGPRNRESVTHWLFHRSAQQCTFDYIRRGVLIGSSRLVFASGSLWGMRTPSGPAMQRLRFYTARQGYRHQGCAGFARRGGALTARSDL